MAIQIRKASKKRAKLRLNIEGQPGGGKTYSAIKLAKLIIGESFKCDNSKVVVIDTERNSAELYADDFDFNVIELPAPNHGPKAYVEAIRAAEASGAEAIVIDSTTHEWRWCQAEADRIKPRFGNNKWSAWSEVKPPHDDFIDAMMSSKAHIIATTRAKPATAEETDERGKKRIVKLGLESIQDDAIEYAYTVVMRVDADHNGIIHKTRCSAIAGKVFPYPGEELAGILKGWLDSGEASTAEDEARAEATMKRAAPVPAADRQAAPPPAPPANQIDPAFAALSKQLIQRATEAANGAEVDLVFIDADGLPDSLKPMVRGACYARLLALALDVGRVEAIAERVEGEKFGDKLRRHMANLIAKRTGEIEDAAPPAQPSATAAE